MHLVLGMTEAEYVTEPGLVDEVYAVMRDLLPKKSKAKQQARATHRRRAR